MVQILRGFTSREVTNPSAHSRYAAIAETDCIFLGSTRSFESAPFEGPLSIRMTDHAQQDGEYVCRVENLPLRMNNSDFLVINQRQPYSVYMECSTPIESFALYFNRRTLADVSSWLRFPKPFSDLVSGVTAPIPCFVDGYHARDSAIGRKIEVIRNTLLKPIPPDPLWLEEAMRNIAFELLAGQRALKIDLDRIGGLRKSTRVELYRRIRRAKSFLDSEFTRTLTIAEVAACARLSPFHLQRCFKKTMGLSIHGYVRAKRMQRAAKLLHDTRLTIEAVATAVGFSHHSSFTRAFSRHFGQSPYQLRGAVAKHVVSLSEPPAQSRFLETE